MGCPARRTLCASRSMARSAMTIWFCCCTGPRRVAAHLVALHEVGSNNPDGIEIKKKKDPATGIPLDGIPFHPYYTVKDIFGVVVFLMVFTIIVFFAPEMGGYFLEHNNFIPADPLKTPPHIAPVWYFTPFYSVLRAVPPMFGSAHRSSLALAT